jgi:hypothetical protein
MLVKNVSSEMTDFVSHRFVLTIVLGSNDIDRFWPRRVSQDLVGIGIFVLPDSAKQRDAGL